MTPQMYTKVGDVIKFVRKSKKMNTRVFAKMLGVSQNMVSLWERGSEPSRETLGRLLGSKCGWVREMALDIHAIQQRDLMATTIGCETSARRKPAPVDLLATCGGEVLAEVTATGKD